MNKEISCWVCPYCEWDTNCCVVEDVRDCLFYKEEEDNEPKEE